MQETGAIGFWEKRPGQYGVENVRKNEKFYILDSELSLQDVTSRHSESTQISRVRWPWGRPKLWLQSDLDCWLWANLGMGSGWSEIAPGISNDLNVEHLQAKKRSLPSLEASFS